MSSLANYRDQNKQGSSSLIPGGFSCSDMDSDVHQMQHGFESNYGLANPQQMGLASAGWKAFFCRIPSDNLCSSSSTSTKAATPEASADFYHSGAVSEVAGPEETLMVAPEPAAWRSGRLLADDSSLRCLLPGVGEEQQRQSLSLSLCNTKPSFIRLQQQQTCGLREGAGHQSNIRDGLLPKTTSFHAQLGQRQQQSLLQESQCFPQLCMVSPSSGFLSETPHQLGNSKYLAPVQELLNEFCGIGGGNNKDEPKKKPHRHLEEGGSSSSPTQRNPPLLTSLDVVELNKRLARLVSMLEELDRRFRKYCEQMKAVVSSFEEVAGEGAATVYSTLASRAMSRHFRCLRDGIVARISETKKAIGEKDPVAPGTTRGETPRLRLLDHHIRQQKAFQHAGTMEAHPWRPQRGLPERSVSVLRAWLFEHFLHPYPSDVDKHILARQTGLSRSQVCNWFINARVRLWKPMVEKMYLEETKEQGLQSTHGNYMGLQDERRPGQSQNPNPGDIPERRVQDDQKPRVPVLLGGSVDADSLSSVVNSTHKHNSVRGQANMYMPGREPRYYPPPRAYQHQLQQLERPDDNFGVLDVDFSSYNECSGAGRQNFGNGVSLTLGLQQHDGASMSLSFTPSSHTSLAFSKEAIDNYYQPMQLSIIDGDVQINPPYKNLMGAQQLLHDLSG